VRLARPSMFMVPMKLVLMVLMGLYLRQTRTHQIRLLSDGLDGDVPAGRASIRYP
jgi:hypothetical protein